MRRPILLLILILMALPSIAIDSDKVDAALRDLDRSLSKRQSYCAKRQHYIDSLTALYNAHSDGRNSSCKSAMPTPASTTTRL